MRAHSLYIFHPGRLRGIVEYGKRRVGGRGLWMIVGRYHNINTCRGQILHPNLGRGPRVGVNTGCVRTCAAVNLGAGHREVGGRVRFLNCKTGGEWGQERLGARSNLRSDMVPRRCGKPVKRVAIPTGYLTELSMSCMDLNACRSCQSRWNAL